MAARHRDRPVTALRSDGSPRAMNRIASTLYAVELETSRDDLRRAHRRVLGRVYGLLVCGRYRCEAKRTGRRGTRLRSRAHCDCGCHRHALEGGEHRTGIQRDHCQSRRADAWRGFVCGRYRIRGLGSPPHRSELGYADVDEGAAAACPIRSVLAYASPNLYRGARSASR